MSEYEVSFPVLSAQHVQGARLFANRQDMMRALFRKTSSVAEVGVAFGHGSDVLIECFSPEEFVAFDTFQLHEIPTLWGKPSAEWFQGKTHIDYYSSRMRGKVSKLQVEEGNSSTNLSKYPDKYFDVIYIDGDHSYEGARADANISEHKLRADGLLIFNDYIILDSITGAQFGVVPCVNDMVVNRGWFVVAMALQQYLFCDVALARRPATSELFREWRGSK